MSKKTLSSLDTEVRLLRHLIDDLYTLSITDVGGMRYHYEQYNIAECIRSALDSMHNATADAGISIEYDSPDSLLWSIDKSRIEQLIFNIITNSIKYTDSPGKVLIRLTERNTSLVLTIEDTSPGCSEDECELLFEPLYRKDQARTRSSDKSSAGLGLAIVRNIVEAHKGTISATPSELGGIKVTITFDKRGKYD